MRREVIEQRLRDRGGRGGETEMVVVTLRGRFLSEGVWRRCRWGSQILPFVSFNLHPTSEISVVQ